MFVGTLGTLLHFLFDWSGGNVGAALFSAVNESIWEHMKLLFYPMVLFAWWEWRVWGKADSRFWGIKLMGVLLGLGLIPVLYYTYTGILGVNMDWFNITIFFIAAAVALYTETKLFLQVGGCLFKRKTVVWLWVIAVLFTVLTFAPPHIPLFRDPVTGTYGLQLQQSFGMNGKITGLPCDFFDSMV